ncbi:MAG: hypothetical protein AAB971_02305 [Patescibacteria group bacterium]
MPSLTKEDRQLLGLLLSASWLSGLVAIVVALLISVGSIVIFEVHNDSLTQQLLSWQQSQPQPALTTPDQLVASEKPTLQTSWPLLVVWSLTGLLVYAIAAAILHSLARVEEVRESLDYVNARPKALLASTAEHLLLRVLGAVILVGFVVAFWKLIVPYGITAAHASAADILSLEGVLYALLSFSMVVVSIQAMTISLRLALGKPRVFT